MDVTCERCGTEYEFDETLVSDRGTTVKCTNCGHLFKVFRPDADGSGAKTWSVRTADGSVRSLGSLKELQRLITDGALDENDLISRGGDDWKRLGDIAELTTFFAAAAAATADTDVAPGTAGRPRRATTPGVAAADRPPDARAGSEADATAADSAPEATQPEPPRAPPPRRPKSTILGVGAAATSDAPPAPDAPPSSGPPRPAPGASGRSGGELPSPPRAPAPDATAPAKPASRAAPPKPPPRPPRRPTPPQTPAPSTPAPAARPPSSPSSPSASPPPARAPSDRPLYLDDSEPAAPPRGRSRSGLWVGLVVLLAAAVGVALAWPQIAPLVGLAPEADPANPHAEAGDDALARDTIEGYEQAVHEYTQALAYDEHDVAVLTRLSRAHALWAQALAFDASDLEAQAEEDPARRGEANAIRREQRRHAETALQRAEDAVRYGSGDASAEVALADALRLTDDLSRSRSRLERALTLETEPSAETLRVEALVEAAEADGDLAVAREKAEAAVAEDPSMIRARLLYARALLAAHEVSMARSQIDAVLRRDGQHPRALSLRDAIEEGRPPAPPTVDVPDGGVADAGAPGEETSEGDEAPVAEAPSGEDTEETGDTGGGGGGGGVPSGRDYSWYVRRADERLERGDVPRARELYEAARAVRPGGSEALTGLGYVALENGDASGAAGRFRQAAGQGYADAYIGLGNAYRRLGRTRDALTAYERYLERLPSGPRASIARRQAEELRRQLGESGGGDEPQDPPGGGAPEPPDEEPSEAPPTDPGSLPAPEGMEQPPPQDVPAVGSEP